MTRTIKKAGTICKFYCTYGSVYQTSYRTGIGRRRTGRKARAPVTVTVPPGPTLAAAAAAAAAAVPGTVTVSVAVTVTVTRHVGRSEPSHAGEPGGLSETMTWDSPGVGLGSHVRDCRPSGQ